jgi:hypothetical protein
MLRLKMTKNATVSQSIFSNETDENPTRVIKSTMSVHRDDETGLPMVGFATNRGKGSGAQIIPTQQFAEVVGLLQSYVSDGLPEEFQGEDNLPCAEVIRRTITVEDGIISFRVRNGKGAKPARIPVDAFAEVVDLLASTLDSVERASKKLK